MSDRDIMASFNDLIETVRQFEELRRLVLKLDVELVDLRSRLTQLRDEMRHELKKWEGGLPVGLETRYTRWADTLDQILAEEKGGH